MQTNCQPSIQVQISGTKVLYNLKLVVLKYYKPCSDVHAMLCLARRQQRDIVMLVFREESVASMREAFSDEALGDKGVPAPQKRWA